MRRRSANAASLTSAGQKFESSCDRTEPWYGTRYSVSRIPEATLAAWRSAGVHEALRLPEVNEFVPTDFDLVKAEEEKEEAVPVVVAESPYGRIWSVVSLSERFEMSRNVWLCKYFVMFCVW